MPDALAAPAAATATLRSVGLFSRWEVVGGGAAHGQSLTVPPPPPPGEDSANSGACDAAARRDATRRHAVLVRGYTGGSLAVALQVKAVRIEHSDGADVTLEHGAVATVELHRCRRLLLRLHGPVAALCVDDCDDVTVELSWEARRGYCNELRPGDDSSQPGFSVFSTGSHSVRVSYPLAAGPDAPRVERVLPETLHTRFTAAAHEPHTSVVDRSRPWGDAPAARAPQPQAARAAVADGSGAAGGHTAGAPLLLTSSVTSSAGTPVDEPGVEPRLEPVDSLATPLATDPS